MHPACKSGAGIIQLAQGVATALHKTSIELAVIVLKVRSLIPSLLFRNPDDAHAPLYII